MKKISLQDLRVIFGEVYIFRHLGGCDHMIVFKEARLFTEGNPLNDILEKWRYPIISFESKMKRKKCDGCS